MRSSARTGVGPLFLGVLALGAPCAVSGALHRQVTSYGIDAEFQYESAIGEVPGHWSLKQTFRDQFLPDSGFGNGVFSVPLDAPTALGFSMDSTNCAPCALLKGREHQRPCDSRRHNAYKCSPALQGMRAFFMAFAEPVTTVEDLGWVEAEKPSARFPVSGSPGKDLFFHEWITEKDIRPREEARLRCLDRRYVPANA